MGNFLQNLANKAQARARQVAAQVNMNDGGRTYQNMRPSSPAPNNFQRVINQINPLDNGRTYKQATPLNTRSIIGQATHSGASNVVGSVAKPLIRSSMALNQGIGNAQVGIYNAFAKNNKPMLNAKQFADQSIGLNANRAIDFKGTKRQITGDIVSNVANIALPGSSKIASTAATRLVPKTAPALIQKFAPKVVGGSAAGAVSGVVGNLGGYVADGQPLSLQGALQTAKTGALYGAALGGAAPLALPVAKVAGKATVKGAKIVDNRVQQANRTKTSQQNDNSKLKSIAKDDMVLAKRQAALDPNDTRSWDLLQRKRDFGQQQARDIQANTVKRSLTDKALSPNVGLTVGGPNALQYMYAKKHGQVFDGVDGKPRFEIDDSGAVIKNPNAGTVGDLLDHPQLYKQYPELKDVKINRMTPSEASARMAGGSYNPDTKTLTLAPRLQGDKLRKTILHELNHKLDDVEGRAGGTSPERVAQEAQQQIQQLRQQRQAIENTPIIQQFRKDSQAVQGNLQGSLELSNHYKANPEYVKASQQLRDLNQRIQKAQDTIANPMHGYDRNLSEAEARAVESRADLPMSKRYVEDKSDTPDTKSLKREIAELDRKINAFEGDSPAKQKLIDRQIRAVEELEGGKAKQTVYHGSSAGGDGTGDRYGKGFYVTTDKNRASGYAKGGAVDEYGLDGVKLANLDDKIDSKIVDTLKKEISDSIKRGDNHFKDALRLSVGKKTFSGSDVDTARKFTDEQKAIVSKLGLGQDSMPTVRKDSNGNFTVTYVDDTLESLKNIDGNRLFQSLPTPTAQSLFVSAGYDGVSARGMGGDVESVIYRGNLKKSEAAPSKRSTFYDSLDVPKDELIIRNGDGGTAMSIDKRAYADDLSPEQNKQVAEYAEFLKYVGQGNGVTMTPDNKRVSSNFRTDLKGQKDVTNTEWFDQARKDLESGKADEYAVEDFKNAGKLADEPPLDIPEGFEAPTPAPVATPVIVPAKNLNAKQYIKERTKAQETARNKDNPTGLKAKYQAAKSDVKSKLVDSFAPIEDTLNKAEKAGAKVAPSQNIKYQIDRVLRAKTISGQYAKDNGLHKVIQNVKNTDEFDQYLIARHTADVQTKTGRDASKDAALVKQLEGKYETQAKQMDTYSQGLLSKSVDYGLISKELGDQLKKQYPRYVPINRIFTEIEQQGVKGSGKNPVSIGQQSVVQRLKGSDREIESPLNSILEKTETVIEQGERNKAASILASYKDLPDNPFSLKELKADETVGTRPVISYLENGKVRRFETTPEIVQAAKALDKQQLGFVGQIFAVPTRVLRLGATGVNVGFTLANVAKDTASAVVNSKNAKTMADPTVFLKALKAATMHGSKEYGELVREGAGGTSFDIARNAAKENVKQVRAGRNMATKAAYTATHPAALLRAIEDTIGRGEELGRAVQYFGNKKAFSKTNSTADATILAADAARNNTVNFYRAGDYGRAANTLIPYLNAGVQGARTFNRTMKDRPVATTTKLVMTAFVPVAAVTAWNLGDDKRREAYESLADTEKENNFILVPPNPKLDTATNRWNVIKIPMSPEIASLAGIVRNGVETLRTDKSFDFKKLGHGLIGTTTSIDTGSARQLLGQVTPQALKPGLETVMNQNLFSGNEVVPKKLKNLDNKDQFTQYTSGTAKQLGKVTGGSPAAIDNAIKTVAGGAGQNIINASDKLLAKAGVIKQEDVKGKTLGSSISNRFSGAQAKSDSTIAKEEVKKQLGKLKQLPEFKSMSQDEQAKALNRLESGANDAVYKTLDSKNGTGQYAQDYKGKEDKLSEKDAGLLTGKTDIRSYLKTSTGGGNKTEVKDSISAHSKKVLNEYNTLDQATKDKKAYGENDYDYKVIKSKFENDKASGTLSRVQLINREQAVKKAEVGKAYSKDLREIYSGLSKDEAYDFLTTDKNGKKYADELLSYGDKLAELTGDKNKFRDKYGNTDFAPKAKTASGRGRKGAIPASTSNVKSRISRSKQLKGGSGIKARKVSLSAKLAGSSMKKYKAPKLYRKTA